MLRDCYRLKKKSSFDEVYRLKQSKANHYLICYYKENRLPTSRYGFSISKKIGKAHVRNKIRRRLGEIIRLNLEAYQSGHDVILIARKGIENLTYQELEANFNHIMNKCGLKK